MLAEVHDEVLLGLELADEFLRRNHADGSFFGLGLLGAFHWIFVRNYIETRWRGLSTGTLPQQACGNVRDIDLFQNQIWNFKSAGVVPNYTVV